MASIGFSQHNTETCKCVIFPFKKNPHTEGRLPAISAYTDLKRWIWIPILKISSFQPFDYANAPHVIPVLRNQKTGHLTFRW